MKYLYDPFYIKHSNGQTWSFDTTNWSYTAILKYELLCNELDGCDTKVSLKNTVEPDFNNKLDDISYATDTIYENTTQAVII